MTVEEIIEHALFSVVRDMYVFAADRKAWPNVNFNPSLRVAHLKIDLLPNDNERLFVKSSDPTLYMGILQLTVVSPLNAGPQAATQLGGLVAGEFLSDRVVYEHGFKVRIIGAPDVMNPVKVDASWNVPVSVRYECLGNPKFAADLDFSILSNSQYVPLI